MFVALTKDKKRIRIEDTNKFEDYYCPMCLEKLIVKKGEIMAHHFAHYGNSDCTTKDGWHYDMSEWHYDWQNQFPVENQEVVFEKNGKKHRADIFINNTVIEFQHSRLSADEFEERNNFYTSLGYRVVWVVDASDEWDELSGDANIQYHKDSGIKYIWHRPNKMFDYLFEKQNGIDIYLQIYPNTWHNNHNYRNGKTEEEIKLNGQLLKVDWISPQGIKYFTCKDDNFFDIDFLNQYVDLSNLINILNPPSTNIIKGNSIPYLCSKITNFKFAGFRNIRTDYKVQVSAYDINNLKKTGKLYGKLCLPSGGCCDYNETKSEVYYWNRDEWTIEWNPNEEDSDIID